MNHTRPDTRGTPLVSLPEQFLASAECEASDVFLHHAGRDWTYAELRARAEAVAAWLAERGVGTGERVGLVLPNSAAYVAAYYGTLLAGACAVTVDAETRGPELQVILDHCQAAAAVLGRNAASQLLLAGGLPPTLRHVLLGPGAEETRDLAADSAVLLELPTRVGIQVAPSLDDLAQIIYTSGTTGQPKGVMLSHRCLAANTRSIVAALGLKRRDSVFVVLPFSYSYGNSLLLTHVHVGGRLVLANDFVFLDQAIAEMDARRAGGFAGIPATFAMLLTRSEVLRRSLRGLRCMTCAGGALPAQSIARLRETLPHVRLFVMYGQTEASARLTTLKPEELDTRPGSAGRPIPGVAIDIRAEDGRQLPPGEVGEVVARGENVMLGYWNDPEGTREVLGPDGLHTGDLGWLDKEGYLYLVGRRTDLIKSGGYRISPQEIEDVLLELEDISEAGVVGAPDPILGEVPIGFVVLRPGAGCTPNAVIEHARKRLPRYKVVRVVRVVDRLPRTSNGKIQRRRLREWLGNLTPGER